MAKRIKWKFKNIDVYFDCEETRLTREVHKMANTLKISPTTKIEIVNDYFTLTESDPANCVSCNSNTTNDPKSTLSMDVKSSKVKSETVQLQPVSGDVVSVPTADPVLEDKPDLSLLNGLDNGMAGERDI